jgi:hypothetical protein
MRQIVILHTLASFAAFALLLVMGFTDSLSSSEVTAGSDLETLVRFDVLVVVSAAARFRGGIVILLTPIGYDSETIVNVRRERM